MTSSGRRPSRCRGEDAEALGGGLDGGDAGHGLELLARLSAAFAQVELVDVAGADGCFEGGGRVFDEDFAVVDDGDAVAELVGFFHVVGGEDDGDAVLRRPRTASHMAMRDCGSRPAEGSSRKRTLGRVGDGAGDLDALGEAAGELAGVGFGALGEVELLEQLGGAGRGGGAGEAEVQAVELDVFVDGAGALERVVLGDDADVAAGAGGCFDDVDAGDVDRPPVGRARVVQMEMVVVLPAPLGPSRP